ncbi:MAG: hypothetical protein ACK42L_10835, partial [Thermoanaerobaculum sp.]
TPRATEVLLRLFTALFERTEHQVTREEMHAVHAELRELRLALQQLTEAQARTDQQVKELVEAQARTEEQVRELVQAQARTEKRVEALAEAQARTDQQVKELVEAQARTEEQMQKLSEAHERLAEAQAKTEARLAKLAEEFYTFRKEVRAEFRQVHKAIGGLSHVVGYTLENLACRVLPKLLAQRLNYQVVEPFDRVWLDVKGKPVQVNLWAVLRTPEGELIRVVGESKTQLGRKHLAELEKLMKRTQASWQTPKALGVLVTHMPDPGVREEAEARGFLVFTSRELEAAA